MWVIFKRKHFCGFESLFCGHCLGKNASNFGLLHLHKGKKKRKKRVRDTEGFSDGYKLTGGLQAEPCQSTGTHGWASPSCVAARGLPAPGLGAGCTPFHLVPAGAEPRGKRACLPHLPCLKGPRKAYPWAGTLPPMPTWVLGTSRMSRGQWKPPSAHQWDERSGCNQHLYPVEGRHLPPSGFHVCPSPS